MSNEQLHSQGAFVANVFQDNDTFIPSSIKFQKIKKGIAAKRTPVIIRAEQQEYSTNRNKMIRLLMPSNTLYETRAGYLKFDVAIQSTNSTYKRLHWNISSIFQRARIIAGATEIEDVIDYNRIAVILHEVYNPTLATSNMGNAQQGFTTEIKRNALGQTTATYICPLQSGVLGTELLPFDNINTGIILELYLEDPTVCVETDGTNPIINVSNIEFRMERLELDRNYRQFLKDFVIKNGLQLGFHTWRRYVNALPSGKRQDVQILHKSSSLNGMLNLFVNSAQTNNTLINNKLLTWIPLGLQQTQLQINGSIFPDEPIDCQVGERYIPFQNYCRWMNRWNLNGIVDISPPIDAISFADNRFFQIDDFEPYPEHDDIINPFNTLAPNSVIIKRLMFEDLTPVNYQLDTWVQFFQQVEIFTDGSVRVLQ